MFQFLRQLWHRLCARLRFCGGVQYLAGTASLPSPLSPAEEKALLARMAAGEADARDALILHNLRLVVYLAKKYENSGVPAEDLISIGTIGLIKAVDKFDCSYEVCFSTYAVPMIIGEVRRYLRDNNSIRVSRSVRDTAYKAIYAKEAMMKESEKEPTIEEVAQKIGIKAENIVLALDAIQNPVSLYEPVYGDGTDTLHIMDQISDKKNKEDSWIEKISLKAAIDHLSDREHKIIKLRYFEGKTQMEVAEEICISQAQVSRLEKKALSSMKHYLG